ncbi:MAG TPA: ornithine cyclodeaminase family protein [Solirubrobacteraceae bacterium]|nr:ornithine cyclodeaminase family protein [Solirubrobacteraceae bacterium]
MRVLMLGHTQVLAALPPDACADAMEAVLAGRARGEAHMPLRSVMTAPGASGLMGLMPAWRGGDDAVFSLKAICVMPGNPARGLDAHQGIVTLFDGETGEPTAILDASAITQVRTAAVSAVATRTLAREDARVLAILGSGVQGKAHLDALTRVRRFEEIRVYSPTRAHAEAIADGTGDAPVSVAASAEAAVRGADVVVTATNAREPVLEHAWLAPGVHVNSVGASIPSARELEVETVAASALFVDSRESLRNEAGEYLLAVQQGAITGQEHVRAELGEVLAGLKPGRRDEHELTLFRSLGLAVEDLAAAEHAVAGAQVLGLGTEVEL